MALRTVAQSTTSLRPQAAQNLNASSVSRFSKYKFVKNLIPSKQLRVSPGSSTWESTCLIIWPSPAACIGHSADPRRDKLLGNRPFSWTAVDYNDSLVSEGGATHSIWNNRNQNGSIFRLHLAFKCVQSNYDVWFFYFLDDWLFCFTFLGEDEDASALVFSLHRHKHRGRSWHWGWHWTDSSLGKKLWWN